MRARGFQFCGFKRYWRKAPTRPRCRLQFELRQFTASEPLQHLHVDNPLLQATLPSVRTDAPFLRHRLAKSRGRPSELCGLHPVTPKPTRGPAPSEHPKSTKSRSTYLNHMLYKPQATCLPRNKDIPRTTKKQTVATTTGNGEDTRGTSFSTQLLEPS